VSLYLAVKTENIDGIDFIRDRLGSSGTIRGTVTPILRAGARVGATEARVHAPRGATDQLAEQIADDAFVFRVRGDTVAARFGVQPVSNPGRGSSLYPLYVHEGTGIYGRLRRRITAKTNMGMTFPGGGKPWPTQFGRTGRVVKYSVRGQRPQPYMERAYDAAAAYIETHLNEVVDRLVN
jgi:hypothetical protein